MNSSKTFDGVIMYLEKIIVDGCDIDYNEISKIAMSPASLFQIWFSISFCIYPRIQRASWDYAFASKARVCKT